MKIYGVVFWVAGDVRLHTQDLEPYRPWMPIRAGEAVIIVTGDPEKWPVLDFGGAVGVSYHPVGTTWLMQNMHIQGLASHSDGYAAGDDYRYEMVNGLMWPSTTGEANHLVSHELSSLLVYLEAVVVDSSLVQPEQYLPCLLTLKTTFQGALSQP